MNEVREKICNEIQASPGIHFNELVRRLAIAPGQAQYHLRRLTSSQSVVEHRLGGRTHYFADDMSEEDCLAIAVIRRETANAILSIVLDNGEIAPKHLSSQLEVAPSTVSYHLDRLEAAGLVEKGYGPNGKMRLSVPNPLRAEELLQATDPDMVDRLTDRFERLVDGLLDWRV